MDAEQFDVVSFLESEGVEYWTSGKNTSRGWISMRCRFCTDHSNHLGINLASNVFSCLKCGSKGGPALLVKQIKDCSWAEAYQTVEQHPRRDGEYQAPQKSISPDALPVPSLLSKQFPPQYLKYLAKRKFNPHKIISKYGLLAGGTTGRYRWRIVAPVTVNGRLVNLIGRDITGAASRKYILEPNEKAPVPRENLIYNLDNVHGDTVLILEGVTDVWRIGDGAVATFGTKFTPFQIDSLLSAGITKAFILYDPEHEAQRQAKRLVAQLSAVMDSATLLEKDTAGDPGEMGMDEVKELRRLVWEK